MVLVTLEGYHLLDDLVAYDSIEARKEDLCDALEK